MLGCGNFIYTLEIVVRILNPVSLFACSLGIRRTLKIASRTSSDVANRVRLCGHHTRRRSRGEVQSRWCGDAEMGRGRRTVLY